MNTNRNAVLSSLLCLALVALPALASSHREAPSIALDPAADNTDLYAWVKPGTHDKLYVLGARTTSTVVSSSPRSRSRARTLAR